MYIPIITAQNEEGLITVSKMYFCKDDFSEHCWRFETVESHIYNLSVVQIKQSREYLHRKIVLQLYNFILLLKNIISFLINNNY